MAEATKLLNSTKFTVLFSGGKDSLAVLLWVLDNISHDNWNILYIEVTGNTHYLCSEYVKKICRVTRHKTTTANHNINQILSLNPRPINIC
ncbi:MAG: hypothetical protein DRN04_14415 [Thermoprotei archaeon]|nr:MAG: hypothetical protein DRN04_14415 [Thermoprotei archaeon]